MPIRKGDGTPLDVLLFAQIRKGDGTVIWDHIPDSGVARWTFDNSDSESGTALDEWNSNDATINGATTGASGTSKTYPTNESYSFDGTDDYVAAPDLSVDSEVSFAVWVNADSIGNDRPIFGVNSSFFGSGSDGTFTMRFDESGFESGNSECLTAVINSTFNETEANVTSSGWMHLVITYSSGSMPSIYKNGLELSIATNNTPSGGIGTDSDGWYLGRGPDPDEFWQGSIDDPRVYDRELTPQEINNIYLTEYMNKPFSKDDSSPILSNGTGWESDMVYGPAVFKQDNTYYLFYTGYDGNTGRIGYATASSISGPWSRAAANPVLDENTGSFANEDVSWPSVVYHDGTYHMVYRGRTNDGTRETDAICHATSTDLDTWTADSNNPVFSPTDEEKHTEPALIRNNNQWEMLYRFRNAVTLTPERIGAAVSDDLVNWTDYGSVIGGSNHTFDFAVDQRDTTAFGPDLVYDDKRGKYIATFSTYLSTDVPGEYCRVSATADSLSGPWTIRDDNPFGVPGADGAWDSTSFRYSSMLPSDDYSVFYAGADTQDTRKIGLGELRL
jgi:hypothetical protein